MQTKILFSFCLLFVSAAVSAQQLFNSVTNTTKPFRNEASFSVSVIPDKTKAVFNLHVYNPEKKKIDLLISHKANGAVVDTVITDVQFNCRYNFDQADDGQYVITLTSGKERVIKTADINTIVKRNISVE